MELAMFLLLRWVKLVDGYVNDFCSRTPGRKMDYRFYILYYIIHSILQSKWGKWEIFKKKERKIGKIEKREKIKIFWSATPWRRFRT